MKEVDRKTENYKDTSENYLLKLFSKKDSLHKVEKLLQENLDWPLLYHLSPVRENLLNWYPFPKDSSILEVGAGCGAITAVLCRKANKVVALELTADRAKIISLRHQNYKNLEVLTGNISALKIKEKFDYVTCIGVLEYAGRYIDSDEPFLKLLKIMKSFLKPNGKLILAIENRLGLKYWAGSPEDHTGVLFDSIYGYPNYSGIKTFGKEELKNLLTSSGFDNFEWYYPLPDYKMPVEIFSDRFLPSKDRAISLGIFPAYELNVKREYIFLENLVANSLAENNLFSNFANSFLVFAK